MPITSRSAIAHVMTIAFWIPAVDAAETFTEVRADGTVVTAELNRSGEWSGSYTEAKDGATVIRGQYRSGKKSGKWEWLRPDGEVSQRQDYKDDLPHGTSQRFHANGKRSVEGKYQNGTLIGPLLIYGPDGKPQRAVHIPRTETEVSAILQRDWIAKPSTPSFVIEPSSGVPPVAGELDPAILDEALRQTRCYRLLSGADASNLRLDTEKNRQAQHGAVLLSMIGDLTHTPNRPGNVPEDFFRLAYDGCNRSNLSQGLKTLPTSIMGLMDDSDPSNIKKVGHRRWILSPKLAAIGFGYFKGFTAMHVVNGEASKIPDWQLIAFPGEGVYPVELLTTQMAWSVLLNSAHFPRDGTPGVSVHSMDEDYQITGDIPTSIITADTKDDAGAYQIIFKPEVTKTGRYWIRLTGMKTPKDRPLDGGYLVHLRTFPDIFKKE